jgi:hypothetical protein
MTAHDQDSRYALECKVISAPNGYRIEGNFHAFVPTNATNNELDQIEAGVEGIGQQLKRDICRQTLDTADERCVQVFKSIQPDWHGNGRPPFTIVTEFGEVEVRRRRLRDPQTGKTLTPSALFWKTSQKRHITRRASESACEASQSVSYRNAAKQLAKKAGQEQLLSTSTVWNKKQEKCKELVQQQDDFVKQVFAKQEVPPPCGVPSQGTRKIEADTIQLQMDEVKTKSQEDDKKWNLTYTATLETADKQCFYLAAESVERLTQQVLAHFIVLGLYLGKRLEVLSDGASWIGDWVGSLKKVAVEHVLCWYHLRTRIYQSLGALGLAKEKRKLLEREILGHLWRGETAKAVWILWGVRPPSRLDQRRPNRIDELIGYLLRKRHMIVDYEDRKQRGLWLSSTRVEKWNDSVADRCKHRGMAWTSQGVLAVVLYAGEQKRNAKKSPDKTPKGGEKKHTTI